jgi:putative ABC transport system substrate-binding protein
MPVIGYLASEASGPSAAFAAAFREGLTETGYIEGQTVAIDYRWAEGRYDRLPGLVTQFVARKVDVIVTGGIPAALAAKSATSTIPIVFSVGDPVERGLVVVTPERSSRAPSPPIYRCNSRRGLSWSSISRPPRRSV